MYCINTINGKKIMCQLIPIPEIKRAKIIIIHDIKKLIKLLVSIETGIISLGKYIFFNIPAFAIIHEAHWIIDVLKKFHGIKAITKNTVKCSILPFVKNEKTKE